MIDKRCLHFEDRVQAGAAMHVPAKNQASGQGCPFTGRLTGITLAAHSAPFLFLRQVRLGMEQVPLECIYQDGTVIAIYGDHVIERTHHAVLVFQNIDCCEHSLVASAVFDVAVPTTPVRGIADQCDDLLADRHYAILSGTHGAVSPPPSPQRIEKATPVEQAPPIVCRCGEPETHEKHRWGLCPTPSPIRDHAEPLKTLGRPGHYSSGAAKRRER